VGKKTLAPDGLLDIHHVTAQGIIAGANMVLVDFHPDPDQALCDGPQALTLEELEHFVRDAQLVRGAYEQRRKLRERLGP
jgi:3-deoxy-7-phosphoheptulonate synthase